MFDLILVPTLFLCFGMVLLFTGWCNRQVGN